MPTPLPARPWQRVAVDIFHCEGGHYLVVIDYFSRYIEVANLPKLVTTATVERLKVIFARFGIPETPVTDNGLQLASCEFAVYARDYDFEHVTSSPRYPQSNGEAEQAFRTVKQMLKKNQDPQRALLAYRSTPLSQGISPAELLMGRRIRSTVPATAKSLAWWPDLNSSEGKTGYWKKTTRNIQIKRISDHQDHWTRPGRRVNTQIVSGRNWVGNTEKEASSLYSSSKTDSARSQWNSDKVRNNFPSSSQTVLISWILVWDDLLSRKGQNNPFSRVRNLQAVYPGFQLRKKIISVIRCWDVCFLRK